MVAFEGMFESEAYVSRSQGKDPKIPSYMGGKFPLSTFLADGVRMEFGVRLHPEPVFAGCSW